MSNYICKICGDPAYIIIENGIPLCRPCYNGANEWKRAVEAEALESMGGPISQRCPRRNESPNPNAYNRTGDPENPDQWMFGRGIITDEMLLSCNYCGSLHPDVFMQKIREGWIVGPTDKSYKAYLSKPEEGQEHGRQIGKFYYQHLSAEQKIEFVDLLNAKTMQIGYPGRFYVPPFFVSFA